MKKGRFLWSAHRITERQKAGKARNIKGKQLKNSRNTASRQHVVLLSSARDNQLFKLYQNASKSPENQGFPGFSYALNGWYSLMKFDETRPILTQFLVVTKWITGKKQAKKRAKWLPNRITEGRFLPFGEVTFSSPSSTIFIWLVWDNLT